MLYIVHGTVKPDSINTFIVVCGRYSMYISIHNHFHRYHVVIHFSWALQHIYTYILSKFKFTLKVKKRLLLKDVVLELYRHLSSPQPQYLLIYIKPLIVYVYKINVTLKFKQLSAS